MELNCPAWGSLIRLLSFPFQIGWMSFPQTSHLSSSQKKRMKPNLLRLDFRGHRTDYPKDQPSPRCKNASGLAHGSMTQINCTEDVTEEEIDSLRLSENWFASFVDLWIVIYHQLLSTINVVFFIIRCWQSYVVDVTNQINRLFYPRVQCQSCMKQFP